MFVKTFCTCCRKEKRTYKNSRTGKIEKHCISCRQTYTVKERHEREFNYIFDIIKDIKG